MNDAQLGGCASFTNAAASPAGIPGVAARRAGHQWADALQTAILAGIRDAIDYGLVVLGTGTRILFTNRSARMELGGQRFVRPRQDEFALSSARHGSKIEAALRKTRRGQRRLAILSGVDDAPAPFFVPLNSSAQSALKYWQAGPAGCILYYQRGACGFGRAWKDVWRGQQRQQA